MQSLKHIKTSEKPLHFKIEKEYNRARASLMTLPHGQVRTPIFMPVGTKGAMKGLTPNEMETLDCWIMLGNTYHLNHAPGAKFLSTIGGLRKFMNWKRNLLTDSGGFQMVSLSKLCEIVEEGVRFEHPQNQTIMFLRPEDSIQAQVGIGADIMMALDDVVSSVTTGPRVEEACDRTIRWIDRCLSANTNPTRQSLFPIVQGSTDDRLRLKCLEAMLKIDANGFAIGGLSGGEKKIDFIRTVALCCQHLPKDKPRYLMGVGFPEDLVLCSALGVDMFDCVYASRTARFGTVLTDQGLIKIKGAKNKFNFGPIDENCDCEACQNYTVAFLSSVIGKQETAAHLLTKHNIRYLLRLMERFRQSVLQGKMNEFVVGYMLTYFGGRDKFPDWVVEGLKLAMIEG